MNKIFIVLVINNKPKKPAVGEDSNLHEVA